MSLRRTAFRLLALARDARLEQELDDEILAHLELAERDARARGLSPEAAQREARHRFGELERITEAHCASRGFRWLDALMSDLRHGIASLVRDPGSASVIVGVLALGIAATVVTFGLVDAVFLRPLPFPDPGRIVRVWEAPKPGWVNRTTTLDFLDWRRLGTAFEALAATQDASVVMTGKGNAIRFDARTVTADYFKVFGTVAQLGRTFRAGDDRRGMPLVVVLSHRTWETAFGADRGILDRHLVLNGQTCRVVGVLPPGAFDRDDAQLWLPLTFGPEQLTRRFHWLEVYGRVRPDRTLGEAREQMRAVYASLGDAMPQDKREWSLEMERLDHLLANGSLRVSAALAFGASALILLLTCANAAGLLLAKGVSRRKELAIRAAVGASRGRLAVQLVTESLVMCAVAGTAGMAVAALLRDALAHKLAPSLPGLLDAGLDVRVAAFAATLIVVVVLLVGGLASAQVSHATPARVLGRSARGSTDRSGRIRALLVVAQVAIAVVLLTGSSLLLRSLLNLEGVETGVRSDDATAVSLDLPLHAYPRPQQAIAFSNTLVERLRATPGIAKATLTTHLPFRPLDSGEGLQVAGIAEPIAVRFKRVDSGYFDALGVRLLAGRGILDRDRDGNPRVLVINQALARRLTDLAGMRDPVGQTARLCYPGYVEKRPTCGDVRVVGIIRDELVGRPGHAVPPVVYVPLAQAPDRGLKLVVRAEADAPVLPVIRSIVREIDPNLPLGEAATLRELRDLSLQGARRPAHLVGLLAAAAAILAALGLYGLLSHNVARQRRSIGIRMALGSTPRNELRRALWGAMRLVAVGLAAGIPSAVVLARGVRGMLFQVSPLDPLTLVATCAGVTLIGLLSALLPAARAAAVDPAVTLQGGGQ